MHGDSTWAMEVYICLPCYWELGETMGTELNNFSEDHAQAVELDIDDKLCWHCKLPIGKIEWNNDVKRWVKTEEE